MLGVSIGSRTSGIAVMIGNELAEYGTLSASDPGSHTRSVMHCVRQFGIVTVVIKVPPVTHVTAVLDSILADLQEALLRHGCMVECKDVRYIKKHIPSVANKPDLMAFVAERFPELSEEHQKELAGKNGYYVKLFEAVAVAYIRSQK